jgi:hypothetical protein
MKVVTPVVGTAVVLASNDDTGPVGGVLPRDLIEFVGGLYKFTARPASDAGPLYQFTAGEFVTAEGKAPIHQIVIGPDGDALLAQNTDLADLIMTDYLARLDKGLGFRFGQANLARSYLSILVVEFDAAFVERFSLFEAIEQLTSEAIKGDGRRHKLKRLAFGTDALPDPTGASAVAQFILRDLLIERRAGEPFERNRFFSRAPLRTNEHIRLLEQIELAAIG